MVDDWLAYAFFVSKVNVYYKVKLEIIKNKIKIKKDTIQMRRKFASRVNHEHADIQIKSEWSVAHVPPTSNKDFSKAFIKLNVLSLLQ